MHKLPAPHSEQQQHNPDGGNLQHFPHANETQIATHEKCDGNRRANREDAPRALTHRLHDDEREHREQDDHDGQNRCESDAAHGASEFIAEHLRKRASVAPHG